MKKTRSFIIVICSFVFLLLLPVFGTAQEEKNEDGAFALTKRGIQMPRVAPRPRRSGGIELGLRLYGGAGMLFGINNLNDAYTGINDWYDDRENFARNYWGLSTETLGTFDPLKCAPFGGMEFFFNLNPFIGFGFGLGYITGKKESSVGFSGSDVWEYYYEESWTLTQKVSAIPVNMTFYGGLPLGNRMRIVPYMGVGLYLGTVSLDSSSYMEDEWDWGYILNLYENWSAKSTAFGFHGGLNFDIYFTRNIGLFVGLGGIVATFKDLIGNYEFEIEEEDYFSTWSDSGTERDYTFWYGENQDYLPNSKWYPWFTLTDDDPNDWWGARNFEPGKISLSQFRFVIGIVIFLMR